MRRTGFTLMELLTVITIIIILMGMLFPIISMIRNHMKKVKTITVIHELEAACNQYKMLGGAYPDSGIDPNTMQLVFMGSAGGKTPKTADQLKEQDWQYVSISLLNLLSTVDRDNFNSTRWPLGYIADTWGNVIRYRPVQYYPYLATPTVAANGHPIAIDGIPPPHQDSYQMWSKGLDGIDQYGDPSSDDITDWQ